MYTKFNPDPRFALQCRSARFFLGRSKTWNCCDVRDAKTIFALLKTFKYTEVIANHYNYCGAVDEHNAYRHDCGTKHGLSLEETWKATRWANRVFIYFGSF